MSLKLKTPLPAYDGVTHWLQNGVATAPAVYHGGPVLVHFWAMSCPACHYNMPHLQELRKRYEPMGLQTIAVHAPRGESDLDVSKIADDLREMHMEEVCAVDNDHRLQEVFQVTGWPSYFLFDFDGRLKCHAMGGLGVKMMERTLIRLFESAAPEPALAAAVA